MLAAFLLPTFALLASAQNVINVTVGVQGSFFVPPTVSARKGDMINFIFGGDIHTITQSTLENPCTYLDGGFDSGLLGRGPQFSKPTQIFTLTVTDVSKPIWFYCAATRPYSHCSAGMVGVINPPSQDVFTSFLNAAKQVQDSPEYTQKVATSGIGATAAAPSTVADLFPTSTPATLTDPGIPITSLPGLTTQSAAPSGNNDDRKAIIGGAVGGAVGLIVLASLGAFLVFCMTKRKRSQQQQQQHFHQDKNADFFTYNHQNPQLAHQQSFLTDSPRSNPMSPNPSPNYITAFEGTERDNLSSAAMMQKQPLLRGNTASTSTMLMTKKPSIQIQPQRYMDNAAHAPSMSQGQGTTYNQQPQGQEYGVAAMTPAAHDISMAQHQDVTHPLPLPALHPLRLQPQHHHASPSVTTSDSGDGINLKALAKEVAAVLKEDSSKSSSSGKARKMATQNPDGSSQAQDLVLSHDQSRDSESLRYDTAPPKYHAVE